MRELPDPPESASPGAAERVSTPGPRLGVVAIGRNEGERLLRCLRSIGEQQLDEAPVVYVDSGSTDGSRERARELGVEVVELDLSLPFSAARARNEGWRRLLELVPGLEFVQFVDGDCEFERGWLARAQSALEQDSELAVVCGRRRELYPHSSVYNRLCDMEWDTPIGEADACGGDALFRVEALAQVSGYDPSLIAGEEPELCFRLRERGWRVLRLGAPMTIHDADIHEFRQFWLRCKRNGHALAEALAMHGEPRHRRAVRSALTWGAFGLPATLVSLVLAVGACYEPEVDFLWLGPIWLLFAPYAYVRLFGRIVGHRMRHGDQPEHARLYARFTIIGKLAESAGILLYAWNRRKGRRAQLIEYKSVESEQPTPSGEDHEHAQRRHSA